MDVSRRSYLSWVGTWLVGFAALASEINGAPAVPLPVACSPEQPVSGAGDRVTLRTWTSAPEGTVLRYSWTVPAGRIQGQAAQVMWDLHGVEASPLPYTATVHVLGPGGMTTDCALQLIVAPQGYGSESAHRGGLEIGRSLLLPNQQEKAGYGLYSYLLFGAPPDGEARARYLQAIAAYLRLIPHLAALKQYFKPRDLNVMYLPMQQLPSDTQTITEEWMLIHYDYTRTRSLMRALPGTNRAGPYLVSSFQPLDKTTAAPVPYLFQDLSVVPPSLVSLWVSEFLNQVAQQNIMKERTGPILVLRIRTIIEQLAITMPEVREALKRIGLPDIGTVLKSWIEWRAP
jgi:hypothetical protein